MAHGYPEPESLYELHLVANILRNGGERSAALVSRQATAQRHLERALAQTRHVHALLLAAHTWHTWLPGPRQHAIAHALYLAELLGAPLI